MSIVVSESASEESLQAYAHPLSIQAKAISDLENTVLNGDVVSDGNNVFTYLTEFSSNMVASIVNKACECFNSLYPENAQTCTELYKHLSDFDYLGLFSSPAETNIEIIFDRNYLIENAVKTDGNDYYKIVLPDYSTFQIGKYTFGIMYPIEIRIRRPPADDKGNFNYDDCIITVMWDTSRANPLKTLESHILEHREFTQESQILVAIEVPIYQFKVDNHVESAVASSGFAKRYDFTGKFYAARIFHWKNDQWNEMAQTLSDINYDVNIPTAMIKVIMELNKVEVIIPQIYFNTLISGDKLGNRVLVKIYTTEGELNVNLSDYGLENYSASFVVKDTILIEDDTYSSMLTKVPTLMVIPLSTRISSGTDGITVDKLRERVKHSASYTVKITPDDLNAYFSSSGFTFTRTLDNVTDRVFCAHKVITDGKGIPIAAGNAISVLVPESLKIVQNKETGELYVPDYSCIAVLDSSSITIKPSAVYKYDYAKDKFYILSDTELTALNSMTADSKVKELNDNLYTYCPFHIRLSMDSSLPIAGSYDLFKPAIRAITFDWENPNTTTEISIYSAEIKNLTAESNKEGYRLSVALFKTDNIKTVSSVMKDGMTIMNIQVLLFTTNSRGIYQYILGTYNGKDSNGHDVFIFDLESKNKITADGLVDVTTMYDETGDNSNCFIDIGQHKYSIGFFIKEEFVTDTNYANEGVDTTGVPGLLEGYVYLCRQTFKLKLGSSLPLLQNNVSIDTSSYKYQNYPTTEFATYSAPIYARWTIADYKTFNLTTDTTFQADKIYYTRSGVSPDYVYTPATVTVGAPVPANTYYERLTTMDKIGTLKLVKDSTGAYKPVVKHEMGDVILSSRYDYTYGPVMNIKAEKDVSALELQEPYTVTSKATNIWRSMDGDLNITGTKYGAFFGTYSLVNREATGTNRVWRQKSTSTKEMYDTTVLTAITTKILYSYVNAAGETVFTTSQPTGEHTTIGCPGGTYLSSNSTEVQNAVRATGVRNDLYNFKAKGTDRKWFFMPGSASDNFDYVNYTGFVIEYGPVAIGDTGLVEHWHLAYYYRTIDAATGLPQSNCYIFEDNLDSSAMLSIDDKSKLTTDSYRAMYDTIYHFLKFVNDPANEVYGWKLYETVDPSGITGLDAYYYAKCYGSIVIYEPWDAEWSALKSGDFSSPIVTQVNTSAEKFKVRVEEALTVICKYITDNGQEDKLASDLVKYLDEGVLTTDTTFQPSKEYYTRESTGSRILPYTYTLATVTPGTAIPVNTYYEKVNMFIVDPLDGKVFTCVSTCDDAKEQEYCNSLIDYNPGIDDPDGRMDAGVKRKLQVGTVDAKGAIYYRDVNASLISNDTYNIPIYSKDSNQVDLVKIIKAWYKYLPKPIETRYKLIENDTGVSVSILRKLLSESEPCFISPWRKLINVSSFGAMYGYPVSYYNNRYIINCNVSELKTIQVAVSSGYKKFENFAAANTYASTFTSEDPEYIFISDITDLDGYDAWIADSLLGSTPSPSCAFAKIAITDSNVTITAVRCDFTEESALEVIMMYGVWSGYMYIISKEGDSSVDAYYHYTSRIDRDYGSGNNTITRTEFNINFENSIWSEVDQWPWEVSSYWIKATTAQPVEININYDANVSSAKVKHMNTDVVLDTEGEPIVAADGSRAESYGIEMLHCDYKLTKSDDADYTNYMSDIRELLRSYFTELNTISPSLLARTKLYFAPIRTLGTAQFKNSGSSITLPVEFSIALGLHVESYVNGSDLNKETIKENILTLIDKRLKDGYINLALLSRDIMDGLSDNIVCVDVLGVNGDTALQTMIPETEDVRPQLKQNLVVNDDGSIHTNRRLDITWYVID